MIHENNSNLKSSIKYVCEKCYFITNNQVSIHEHEKKCTNTKKIDLDEYIRTRVELVNTQEKLKIIEAKYTNDTLRYKLQLELCINLLRNNTSINIDSIQHVAPSLNSQDACPEQKRCNQMVEQQDSNIQTSQPAVQLEVVANTMISSTRRDVDDCESTIRRAQSPIITDTQPTDNQPTDTQPTDIETVADEKKRVVYRAVKGMTIRDEYTDSEWENIYKDVETKETEDEEYAELYKMTEDECIRSIDNLVIQVRTGGRQYVGELNELKSARLKLFKFYNIPQYIDFLREHIDIMKNIMSNRMDNKKVGSVIKTKVLLPLELRLLEYNGYENSIMDTNEISYLKKYLRYRHGFSKNYNVFNLEYILGIFSSYNIAFFNIIDYMKIILPNKYGINNIIYVNVPKANDADPFSYYYLESHDKTNNWRMDCRLDDFTSEISRVLKEYCVALYRKIYYKIYHDNVYREEHNSSILEMDGEQLIQNIILLGNYSTFNRRVREVIKEKCSYVPTKNDKFNLYCDDILNKKRFSKLVDEETDVAKETIGRLYDNISNEQLEDLYQKKCMS